jgi:hypothetical protein
VVVVPEQALTFVVNATNLGNTVDDLELTVTHTTSLVDGDTSMWDQSSVEATNVEIGGTVLANLTVRVPSESWNGSTTVMQVQAIWQGEVLETIERTLTVGRVSGWRTNLSGVDLVVPPEGGVVEVPLDHLGNSLQSPWFAKVAEGWGVTAPLNGSAVSPYGASTVLLNVTPPNGTEAGDVGTVNLRISDGDGEGASTHVIPVRVAAEAGLIVQNEGVWWLSETGGMPVAWLENTGNDVARVEVTVSGHPATWELRGPTTVTLAPGARSGLPLSLVPDDAWDGTGRLITVSMQHPMLDAMELQIETRGRDVAFSSSPVLVGQQGGRHDVSFTDGHVESFHLERGFDIINLDEGGFKLVQFGLPTPDASVECVLADSISDLGRTPFYGNLVTCDSSTEESTAFAWTLMDGAGQPVPIDHSVRTVPNGSQSWTINASGWTPAPGQVDLRFVVHDARGVVLDEATWSGLARASGWNLGIESFTFDGEEAVLGIRRAGSDLLNDAPCTMSFNAGAGRSSMFLVDVSGDFAPTLRIDLSSMAIPADTEVTAELRCAEPFDVDDDASDDTASAILRSGVDLGLTEGGWVWALGALLIVSIVGRSLLPKPELAQATGPVGRPAPSREQAASLPEPITEPSPPHEEDLGVVVVDEVEVDVSVDDKNQVDVEPEPAGPTLDDATDASSRLARLRGELQGDGPDDDMQRRMNRFFER